MTMLTMEWLDGKRDKKRIEKNKQKRKEKKIFLVKERCKRKMPAFDWL